jgi:hypothetical protein
MLQFRLWIRSFLRSSQLDLGFLCREGEDIRPDWYGGNDDDSDDEYGRPKGQRKKKRRSRSPKRWYPKKDRIRKPPELGPDGLPIKKDKKKKKQEWVWEEEPD